MGMITTKLMSGMSSWYFLPPICIVRSPITVALKHSSETDFTRDLKKFRHARRHYEATVHSVVSSAELGEQWLWCFVHEQGKEY
jgi:hypothetical protein